GTPYGLPPIYSTFRIFFLTLAHTALGEGQGCMCNPFSNSGSKAVKSDIYQRVTDQIVASLETGIRPWLQKPWSGEHAAGRITRPLRENGIPYQGINILMLWGTAMQRGYTNPYWMTFNMAL